VPSLAIGESPAGYRAGGRPKANDPVSVGGMAVDIRSAQKLAWGNKVAKGFNTTNVPLEFCLLSGEVAEAFDSWRKGRSDVAEELADAAIFLVGLAEMIGADLQEAVEAKLAANEARVYRALSNGVLVKDQNAGPPENPGLTMSCGVDSQHGRGPGHVLKDPGVAGDLQHGDQFRVEREHLGRQRR
jgi:hypothetical protein